MAGRLLFVSVVSAAALAPVGRTTVAAQERVTGPVDALGFEIGADYQLANYQALMGWWETLARESDRMVLDTTGLSEEGRPQLMAILTSPENHADLDRYRAIARRLALAEGVTEAEARRLAEEGKAIVWIDGGLHATEVLGAQQLMEFVYQMVSRSDEETARFLDDVIVLAVHANPDGHDLVADWYMRRSDPMERSTSGLPVLYEKYAGHDNNRDFYMSNLAETTNMNRVAYREWFPQIIYNHHQTGPAGTVMFAPPFRDPPNHYIDPLMLVSLQRVGSAMHERFVAEGKGGTTMRSGASYSTWWNGGLRTTPYFHNMIGLLTETIGNPTPVEIPFIPSRQIPSSDLPLPVEPGPWHFRQSVDYSQTANRAVLDYASRNKELLLYNIWRMGMNAIERGRRDSWRTLPSEVYAAEEQVQRGSREDWERLFHRPEDREPRGYVIPSDQPDFGTATKFVNVLLKNGVAVHRATSSFVVGGTTYPTNSYVVRTDQAFAPHVFDMMERQDHPNDFAYPGGPPIPPYDVTGWTVAYQMGVEFDRILDGFDGPFEPITTELASPPPGRVIGQGDGGFLLDHRANDAFIAVNRLLAQGREVHWMTEAVAVPGGGMLPPGGFFITGGSGLRGALEGLAAELGLDFYAVEATPAGPALDLDPVRIGLWDQYGGSMPSGWTRFMLEEFEFPFRLVFPPELDEGNLIEKFDVLVFPDGAIPGGGGFGRGGGGGPPDDIPAEYRDRWGRTTVDQTVPRIVEFLEAGGTVVAIGSSTVLGEHAGLPIEDHLVGMDGQRLDNDEYYIPGAILEVKLEHVSPAVHGMGERVDVFFERSPVWTIDEGATNVRALGWFDNEAPLRSGWAWGQEHLLGGATLVEADVGQGKLFLYGPEVTFRAQPHGTFPLVFNAIYYGTGEARPAVR